eukprot:CAMPEP_0196576546 /NCGR_PEP_ID=MMETSP1081-20130531/5770_1 /TAXON_ID=36882 /ORGANISM="Pyramimonas amylifera, Strain CCMP720" /LENGTH=455 /DNA_ID=CAMNT_0041895171 /DNA_START=57 /DNA_END=1424 /DNA_ORIENTATION=-
MQTQFSMLFGDFQIKWTENIEMISYTISYMVICFLLIVNFVLAIIVEAYMKLRDDIKENQIQMEFFTDLFYSLQSKLMAFIHQWPSKDTLILVLHTYQAKQSIGYTELLNSEVFADGLSLTRFLKHYRGFQCLHTKERRLDQSEQIVRDLEARIALILEKEPTTYAQRLSNVHGWSGMARSKSGEVYETKTVEKIVSDVVKNSRAQWRTMATAVDVVGLMNNKASLGPRRIRNFKVAALLVQAARKKDAWPPRTGSFVDSTTVETKERQNTVHSHLNHYHPHLICPSSETVSSTSVTKPLKDSTVLTSGSVLKSFPEENVQLHWNSDCVSSQANLDALTNGNGDACKEGQVCSTATPTLCVKENITLPEQHHHEEFESKSDELRRKAVDIAKDESIPLELRRELSLKMFDSMQLELQLQLADKQLQLQSFDDKRYIAERLTSSEIKLGDITSLKA